MESDPGELETHFQHYMADLKSFLPDGVIEVDLELLQDLDLLHSTEYAVDEETPLSQSFYVVETSEKLTLFNDRFAVWIVPKLVEQVPTTYTLIALKTPQSPHLEVAFATTGVYNHSSLVLRILEKFLQQIDENENELIKFNRS